MSPTSDHESDSASHVLAPNTAEPRTVDHQGPVAGDAVPEGTAHVVLWADDGPVATIEPVGASPFVDHLLEDDSLEAHAAGDHNVTFNLVDATLTAANGNGPSFDQDGVTLSLHDVLDIGTESVGHLQALVVTGDHGDVVRLQNDNAYNWQVAEGIGAPEGFTAYQAVAPSSADPVPHDQLLSHHMTGTDVYVLVQHDLQVLLTTRDI